MAPIFTLIFVSKLVSVEMACLLGIQNEIQALCTKIQNAFYAALAGIVFRYLYKSANYEEFLTKYLNTNNHTLHFLYGMLFLQCSKTCLQHEEKFEACRDFFSGQIKRANDQDLFGYKNSKNRGNTKDIFSSKYKSVFWEHFFSEQTIGSKISSKRSSV